MPFDDVSHWQSELLLIRSDNQSVYRSRGEAQAKHRWLTEKFVHCSGITIKTDDNTPCGSWVAVFYSLALP
jgi:hypothetical protein